MISLGVTVLASALLCGAYLKLARRWQLLAHPNERSSHALPTPHGGGVPLYLAMLLGLIVAASLGQSWSAHFQLITSGALLLVAVGVLDDLVDLSAPLRFAIYCVCCVVVVLQPFPPQRQWFNWLWVLIAAFGLLWLLNLYNFMDGIDGIENLGHIAAVSARGVSHSVLSARSAISTGRCPPQWRLRRW